MGVYVQQDIKKVDVVFSGIWPTPKTVEVEFVEHAGIVFMTVPDIIFPNNLDSGFIAGRVPGHFNPFQDVECFGWGTNSDNDTAISFKILTDGTFVIKTMPGHAIFVSEGGSSGIYSQTFIWQLNALSQN